ncbi:DUF2218 domain-containing protein [Corynebacterium halotolerans]|uniref:DUF2218 domain-containing protein n=1 Tax=Corynebacterium halotolerans TaxID=225326 RepID=UPI003CF2C214
MTISSTARVATDRPARYGKQLASHFSKKLATEWDAAEGRGHLTFTGDLPGEVGMIAGDKVLLLHLETAPEHLADLEAVVGRHLVRFGARDELSVTWRREGGEDGVVVTTADLED